LQEGANRGQLDPWAMVDQFGNGEESTLFLMKNSAGQFLYPTVGFTSILYWDLGQAYYVNVRADVTGMWPGRTIPAQTPIAIHEGWNMIPFYPNYDLDISVQGGMYALSTIENLADVVDIAKDDQGGFVVPRIPFAQMAPWTTGKGYQISVTQDIDFTYPTEQDQFAGVGPVVDPSEGHWTGVARTGSNMSVLVSAVRGLNISEGDQVAAFDRNGRIVGVGTFDASGRAGLPVWGDEGFTRDITEGMKVNETFTLKLWNADKGVEFDAKPLSFSVGKELKYTENGLLVLDVKAEQTVPTEYYVAQNFPNPFNAVTKLSFGLPENAKVKVRVFDLAGRLVATLVDGEMKAGNHYAVWDGQSAAAGMYVIRIESANFNKSVKAVLMK
jgi:hypothetical protein